MCVYRWQDRGEIRDAAERFRLEPVEALKYLLDSCSVTEPVCRPAPVTNTVPELQKTGDV